MQSRGAAGAAEFFSVDGRQVATVKETADGRRREGEYRVGPSRNRCTVCDVGVGPEHHHHQEGPTISVRPSHQGAHHPPVQMFPVGPATVGGCDDEYIYDYERHINSVLGNGLLERLYIYVNGQPLAEYFESTTYFMHSDHLGSIWLLTRLDQTVCESDDYYPFGEQIPRKGGTAGTLKFTGKERDTESGLDNFGARYHASSLAACGKTMFETLGKGDLPSLGDETPRFPSADCLRERRT